MRIPMTFATLLVGLSFAVPFGSDASGALIGFSDRSVWENQISDQIITEDFDNVTPGLLPLNTTTTVGLIDVFPFASGGDIFRLQLQGTNGFVNGQVDTGPENTPEGFSIIFPSPVSAFGADFEFACDVGGLKVQWRVTL